MLNWTIKEKGYKEESASSLGNRYLIGNGYMGIRGTLEEYQADKLPAINLAGIYDQVGNGWREPINAPNGCFSYLRVDGENFKLPDREPLSHEVELNYRYGIFKRTTTWRTARGNITLCTERYANMQNVNGIGIRFEICADFHADVELVTGIDCDVWDLNGPHLKNVRRRAVEGVLLVEATTREQEIPLAVAQSVVCHYPGEIKRAEKGNCVVNRIFFITKPSEACVVEKWIGIYSGKECENPAEQALNYVKRHMQKGYEKVLEAHKQVWEGLWKCSEVIIKGDDAAMEAVNYSLYHLHSIAPRHTNSLSIPARGLSGQTYKGAVFWDTEMFMLDFFLMTDPATARTLMQYRIDTLDGAMKKAEEYGYEGAFYAWESQEGGHDACTDYNVTDVFTGRPMRTYFRDKQVHITAAVAYGILRYVEWTGDESILNEKGVKTIIECARFYYSMLVHRISKDYYEILDVIGPDEYHERVNNNGYTNRMAKFVLEKAAELIKWAMKEKVLSKEYNGLELIRQFTDAATNLYIQRPGKKEGLTNIIEQFDGYFNMENATLGEVRDRLLHEKEYWGGANGVASHTQIIKQADVVTWLNLFSDEFSEDILRANWEFYEPRTEHGSSLSAGMYAMLACKIGEPDKAYPFFMKSARADLQEGGKEWAGLIYIGGTHPAAAGAAYMTAIEGFGGISLQDGKLVCNPSFPSHFEEMRFMICHRGKEYEVYIKDGKGTITML